MSRLIQKNPYAPTTTSHYVWAGGFEAGQKSTLLPKPVSVTGRWWQTGLGKVEFAYAVEYEGIQRAIDSNQGECRWLTDEETREFE